MLSSDEYDDYSDTESAQHATYPEEEGYEEDSYSNQYNEEEEEEPPAPTPPPEKPKLKLVLKLNQPTQAAVVSPRSQEEVEQETFDESYDQEDEDDEEDEDFQDAFSQPTYSTPTAASSGSLKIKIKTGGLNITPSPQKEDLKEGKPRGRPPKEQNKRKGSVLESEKPKKLHSGAKNSPREQIVSDDSNLGDEQDEGEDSKKFLHFKKALSSILTQLTKKDKLKIFTDPVSPEEVPDYYQVIKNPMCFYEMRKKLRNGEYTSVDTLQRDFYLLCDNAMLYNAPNTIYYKEAEKLKKEGTDIIKRMLKKIDPNKLKTDGQAPPTPAMASPTPPPATPTPAPTPVSSVISDAIATKPTRSTATSTRASQNQLPATNYNSFVSKGATTPATTTPPQQNIELPPPEKVKQASATTNTYSNYMNNFIYYRTQPPMTKFQQAQQQFTHVRFKPEVTEQQYSQSLESFVRDIEPTAIESIQKFIKNLRQPLQASQPPQVSIPIGQDLYNVLFSSQQEQSDGTLTADQLKDLVDLTVKDGYDISFLESLDSSLKEIFKTPESEASRKIQEQLDKNSSYLYVLQVAQHERGQSTTLSEKEYKLMAQLGNNLHELTARFPPQMFSVNMDHPTQ